MIINVIQKMENVCVMVFLAEDVNLFALETIMDWIVPRLVIANLRLNVKDLMEVVFACRVLEETIVHKKFAQLTDLGLYVNIPVLVI